MFEYLVLADRDVTVSAIYRALLRLFEAKGGSRMGVGIPDRLSNERRKSEIDELSARIISDIIATEKRDLSVVPAETIREYTSLLTQIASSRYVSKNDARSEAIRFLQEIDPAKAEYGLVTN